jgi:2-dehydro-3-deoxyphosphogluconate aldolase/(4S)-4-hydroxy-2-oxoglutarate aldolase
MSLLDRDPVIPVVVIEDAGDAVPLAHALLAGGVTTIEVTLRTDAALEAVRRIAAEVPDICLGVGTVLRPEHAKAAAEAGAQFLVTPGTTASVLGAVAETGLPCLPGAATVSEVMALVEQGFTELKFFPAEASGGPAFLHGVGGPVPEVRFCPTGGITAASAGKYLALPNVGCVGGTWLTPKDAIAAGDWARVSRLAAATAELRGGLD